MLTLDDVKSQVDPKLFSQLFYGLVERKIMGSFKTIKWEMISFTKQSFHRYKLSEKYPSKGGIPNLEEIEPIDVPVETFKDKFKKHYLEYVGT